VSTFIARYLASRETVLILQGPPGTGKTRLVRAILAAMSARKADSAQVLYTANMRALENDEIFVDFITGNHDAFVIEDADHLLMARSNGNVDLHRFLAVADGVVRGDTGKSPTSFRGFSGVTTYLIRFSPDRNNPGLRLTSPKIDNMRVGSLRTRFLAHEIGVIVLANTDLRAFC
jgi:hypothetical protein